MNVPQETPYTTARHYPGLTVTGQSHEVGGWISGLPFLYDDPVYPGAFPHVAEQVRLQLEQRMAAGQIALADLPPPLLGSPRTSPRSRPRNRDQVWGALLGTAIGDALGNTSESQTPAGRAHRYGEIRHYLPNRHAQGEAIGLPSDDTQLTVWTLEALLQAGQPDLNTLVHAYRQHRIYGIGNTMKRFFSALDALGPEGDVWQARQDRAGNGALMRVAGAFLPHAWTLDAGALDSVALTSALTHDHSSSTASCVAFARILGQLLEDPGQVAPGYFIDTFLETARPLEGDTQLLSRQPGNPFSGSLCTFVETHVPAALKQGLPTVQALDSWYSGAYLLETVPTVLFLLERYHHDPEEALIRAVMDSYDNDTIAAIVGAVVGALHGAHAFPQRWVRALSGKTAAHDPGRVQQAWQRLRCFGGNG
jgi:ADP-ribosylglycohydrolase